MPLGVHQVAKEKASTLNAKVYNARKESAHPIEEGNTDRCLQDKKGQEDLEENTRENRSPVDTLSVGTQEVSYSHHNHKTAQGNKMGHGPKAKS